MKYLRYGNKKQVYRVIWVSLLFLVVAVALLASLSFMPREDFALMIAAACLMLLFATVVAIDVVRKANECFELQEDGIVVWRGKRQQKIELPASCVLVISYADIDLLRSTRTGYYRTPLLKGECAVSILPNMSAETAVDKIHKTYARRYATSTVRAAFDRSVLYSFVCDQSLLNAITKDRSGLIVLPESLQNRMILNQSNWAVHIDRGY